MPPCHPKILIFPENCCVLYYTVTSIPPIFLLPHFLLLLPFLISPSLACPLGSFSYFHLLLHFLSYNANQFRHSLIQEYTNSFLLPFFFSSHLFFFVGKPFLSYAYLLLLSISWNTSRPAQPCVLALFHLSSIHLHWHGTREIFDCFFFFLLR